MNFGTQESLPQCSKTQTQTLKQVTETTAMKINTLLPLMAFIASQPQSIEAAAITHERTEQSFDDTAARNG